jgi:hypothetical protein
VGTARTPFQDRRELYGVDFNSEEMTGRAFRAIPIKYEHIKRKIGLTAFIGGVNNKAIAEEVDFEQSRDELQSR